MRPDAIAAVTIWRDRRSPNASISSTSASCMRAAAVANGLRGEDRQERTIIAG